MGTIEKVKTREQQQQQMGMAEMGRSRLRRQAVTMAGWPMAPNSDTGRTSESCKEVDSWIPSPKVLTEDLEWMEVYRRSQKWRWKRRCSYLKPLVPSSPYTEEMKLLVRMERQHQEATKHTSNSKQETNTCKEATQLCLISFRMFNVQQQIQTPRFNLGVDIADSWPGCWRRDAG